MSSTAASQVLLSIYPSKTRFRQTRPKFELVFINNSPHPVTIDPVGTVRISEKNGNEIRIEDLDYSKSAPITLSPNSRSSGWWFYIWGFGSNRLRKKEIINVSVTFKIRDYPLKGMTPVIAGSISWKAKLGPGINIIKVGSEDFTSKDNQTIHDSLQITREIYEQVDFTLGDVDYWIINNADAGNYRTINSLSEAINLIHNAYAGNIRIIRSVSEAKDWTVRNDMLNIFVVRAMIEANGMYVKRLNGAVVSLNGSTLFGSAVYAGITFAHEIGHYLGLKHIADKNNFMFPYGSSSKTGIEVSQYKTMRNHYSVRRLY